jgi:Mg-chelatase subunit ChlD
LALDISGSMAGRMKEDGSSRRLDLALNAILMLIEKLRLEDKLGLITFNT